MLTHACVQEELVVEDLYEDLKDGLKLIHLLENLSHKPIVRHTNINKFTQTYTQT